MAIIIPVFVRMAIMINVLIENPFLPHLVLLGAILIRPAISGSKRRVVRRPAEAVEAPVLQARNARCELEAKDVAPLMPPRS
jgi:hypothetical protein